MEPIIIREKKIIAFSVSVRGRILSLFLNISSNKKIINIKTHTILSMKISGSKGKGIFPNSLNNDARNHNNNRFTKLFFRINMRSMGAMPIIRYSVNKGIVGTRLLIPKRLITTNIIRMMYLSNDLFITFYILNDAIKNSKNCH